MMMRENEPVGSDDHLRPYADALCQKRDEECSVLRKVGDGNSASVYQVLIDGKHAALKVYEPRFFEGKNREVEKRRVMDQMALKGHGHPNLIDFLDAGPIQDTYYLLMEYFPWPSLDNSLESVERSRIGEIIAKVASAAEFLEEKGLVHRDIKPANILASEDAVEVKLLDLGVIRTISAAEEKHGTDHGYALPFVATAQYSSPAYLFRDSVPTEEMWRALTFYQLGAVLHDLIMAKPIFSKDVRSENRYRVAAAVLLTNPEVRADDIHPKLITLARSCLLKEDQVRLQRVSWSRFRGGYEAKSDDMRQRLGLGIFQPAPQFENMSTRKQLEKLQVRLDEAQDNLLDLVQHVFRQNGFPRAVTNKFRGCSSSARFVSLTFQPSNATRVCTSVIMTFRLSAQEDASSRSDISLSTFLSTNATIRQEFDGGECLWTSTLDDLKVEDQAVLEALAEACVRHYAMADEHLSRFEDPSFEDDAITVEVS
jgi:serine/threonine-protein kinase